MSGPTSFRPRLAKQVSWFGVEASALARVLHHEAAVRENWRVFHIYPPSDLRNYVYQYFDAAEQLLYVGMTSSAAKRALRHWQRSDWWSWVASVSYQRCPNRDAAFKLESKIRAEQKPLFRWTGGYADLIRELDEELMINHVLGYCGCLR